MTNARDAGGTIDETGADDASPWRLPASSGAGRVCLIVTELDRVTAFYRDVVGLSVLSGTNDRTSLGVDGEPLIELRADPDAPERGRTEAGLFHTAIRVPSRAALADALARIREEWRLDGASDHHVSEALYLTDPEGNGVEIYCDRPREAWPIDDQGRVEMDTLPLDLGDLAATATGTNAAPSGTDLGHVHLEATDLGAAREFYADALGLNRRQRMGASALFLAAGDYHHHVGLNTWNGRSAPRSGRGLAWFELRVPAPALATLQSRLEAVTDVEKRSDGSLAAAAPDGLELRLAAER